MNRKRNKYLNYKKAQDARVNKILEETGLLFANENVYYLDKKGSDDKLEWASVVVDRTEYVEERNDKLPWMISY